MIKNGIEITGGQLGQFLGACKGLFTLTVLLKTFGCCSLKIRLTGYGVSLK